jgi:Ni,Fe-hydrogenase maturation factor
MTTLVLGLGNDLLADDAVGVLAVRELERPCTVWPCWTCWRATTPR